MENSNTEAAINFCFKRLNKLQAFTLVREIVGSSYEEELSNNCFIGFVPLSDSNLDDINDFYVRQRVDISDCAISVAVNSSSGTKTIEVPVIVNRMLKYIDCRLAFTFTVV